MARIIAIGNVKGGVGKTTTTTNLAAALTERGRKVLAVDLDPQASLTQSVGCGQLQFHETIANALSTTSSPINTLTVETRENFSLVPATHDLYDTERELQHGKIRILALENALQSVRGAYDYILLDCPANAGILTGNALAAADEVIIPFPTDFLAYQTLGWFSDIIGKVKKTVNPSLRVSGVFVSMYDPTLYQASDIVAAVKQEYGLELPFFSAAVPQTATMKQAARVSQSVLRYAPQAVAAAEYRLLAREVEEGIRTGDNDAASQVRLGYAALAELDTAKAYAAFHLASTLAPNLPEAWIGRSQSTTKWDERVRSLAQAYVLRPYSTNIRERLEESLNGELRHTEVPQLMSVAHFLVGCGLSEYAHRAYQAVTELDPDHEQAWLGRAHTAENASEKSSALQRVLQLDPDNVAARNELAKTTEQFKAQCVGMVLDAEDQAQQGSRAEAYAIFAQVVEMDPTNDRAWIGLARTSDDMEQSLAHIQQALKLNPGNAEAREIYSWLWKPSAPRFELKPLYIVSTLLALAAIVLLALYLYLIIR